MNFRGDVQIFQISEGDLNFFESLKGAYEIFSNISIDFFQNSSNFIK